MKCSRCNRQVNELFTVAGIPGEFGKQCALEVCQGRVELIRAVGKSNTASKKPTPLTDDEIEAMGGLPF